MRNLLAPKIMACTNEKKKFKKKPTWSFYGIFRCQLLQEQVCIYIFKQLRLLSLQINILFQIYECISSPFGVISLIIVYIQASGKRNMLLKTFLKLKYS